MYNRNRKEKINKLKQSQAKLRYKKASLSRARFSINMSKIKKIFNLILNLVRKQKQRLLTSQIMEQSMK